MEFFSNNDTSFADVLGRYDTPAYVRRGVQLKHAREQLFERCQAARNEHLRGVRLHLRMLHSSISSANQWRGYLASERDYQIIAELQTALNDRCDAESAETSGPAPPRSRPTQTRFSSFLLSQRAGLRSLIQSMERFNRRWNQVLAAIDVSEVNRQVDDYNRYYLLEKECAMRSPRLAARGFVRAQRITHDELAKKFPLLEIPRCL